MDDKEPVSNEVKPEKKKKRHDYTLQRANSTHVVLLVLIGAYFVYMAYQMYDNTVTGESEMAMSTTIILMIVMILVAAAVFVYAGYVWYHIRKKSELTEEEAAELDKEMAKADIENYGKVVGDYETDVSEIEKAAQEDPEESDDSGDEEEDYDSEDEDEADSGEEEDSYDSEEDDDSGELSGDEQRS